MTHITRLIEKNFSLLLLLGALLGFFVPSFGEYADEIVIVLTALLIFLACADIELKDFFEIDIFNVGLFSLLRFTIFPLALFYVSYTFFPDYAMGVLLLSLMPAGVAVASLCSMSNAKVSLGLSITIISSLLMPLYVPGIFMFLGQYVEIDIFNLLLVLIGVVILPLCLYFLLVNRVSWLSSVVKRYNKSTSVLTLSLILVIVIAAQKEDILSNFSSVVYGLIFMTALFAFYYAFGVIYSLFISKANRVPYIFGSGAMNNSLAVGLAFIYFDAKTSLFIILSEIVWSFYVAGAQYYFSKQKS